MISALDKDQYDDSEPVTIKFPSSLPYYTNSKSFTRMDEEIVISGVHFSSQPSAISYQLSAEGVSGFLLIADN